MSLGNRFPQLYRIAHQSMVASIILGISITAHAQQSPATSGPGASIDSTGTQLTEIIVTAQKRRENLQDVPIAVSAVGATQLANMDIHLLTDLTIAVPGLNVNNSYGRLSPSLRGIGSSGNYGPGIENPVALYIDGVYYASTAASLLSLNNVAQVEVLKGPQGTLFGRNATAGLINVTTQDPSQEVAGNAEVSFANYQTRTVNLYLSGGLTDHLAADIAAYAKQQHQGWGTNLYTGGQVSAVNHDVSLRTKWLWTPQEGTKVTLIVDYENLDDTNLTTVIRPGSYSAFEPGVPQPDLGYNTDSHTDPVHFVHSEGASLNWEQAISDLTFTSLSSARYAETLVGGDLGAVPQATYSFKWYEFDRQYTQEFQLNSPRAETFNWTTGLYYFKGASGLDPGLIVAPAFGGININTPIAETSIQSEAAYAQGSYKIFDATKLTLGVRYTDEQRAAVAVEQQIFPLGGTPSTPTAFPTGSESFSNVSYRASLDHRFSPSVLGYVSYSTAFRAGGFNVTAPGTPPFKPEKLGAAEVVLKTDFLDDRVRFNVAGYYEDYKDIQVEAYVVSQPASFIINGGKARSYGADADLQLAIAKGLTVTSGLSAGNATFTSFPGCPIGVPQGGVALAPGDCTGNRFPGSTRFTFSTAVEYAAPASGGTLYLNGNGYYNGGFFTDVANDISQPSYTKLGASVRWATSGDRFYVKLYGTNLTNVRTKVYGDSQGNGTQLIDWAEPRIFGIAFGTSF
jgi:iron complex outermembrane recepter protein